ncbi:hypothetical protein ATANTOWER_018679 [Ataeniobius toweri]|uniref:Uncharacterized protein n=1 Tax=Ataeniobius toweri TaxID=208326 RepID=A0ABU7A705_9TELE|nr:hypothetical protein [Ataeniobius toweri]
MAAEEVMQINISSCFHPSTKVHMKPEHIVCWLQKKTVTTEGLPELWVELQLLLRQTAKMVKFFSGCTVPALQRRTLGVHEAETRKKKTDFQLWPDLS